MSQANQQDSGIAGRIGFKIEVESNGFIERREYRRHDLEDYNLSIDRWDGSRQVGKTFGRIVDLSAGGVRLRASASANLKQDQQIRVRLALPAYAGIKPFVKCDGMRIEPREEWVGWMAVCRVKQVENGEVEIAGKLVDMDDADRGMLGLYLSTQPLAA